MTEFPVVSPDTNVKRQVLADTPTLMMVAFTFEAKGAEGALHSHPHVQSTFVESGRFMFTIDGVQREVGPGDTLIVESGLEHGCVCLEPGRLIDNFSPRRDDFL
ncbi:cupin domain-containing protein [Alphaproteobacteria bacterium KMM 3653]|uniref:Cupin domain-containing protein n=1 Tax=Harenicola maris TaxID=2841044 RepID=A0AAP2CP83_9RHOB|nr:cupin domain-containing protein [Harenicola maris]